MAGRGARLRRRERYGSAICTIRKSDLDWALRAAHTRLRELQEKPYRKFKSPGKRATIEAHEAMIQRLLRAADEAIDEATRPPRRRLTFGERVLRS
jgi:hypothetical protein